MSEFASNCPISRPINTGWKTDWDLGGWSWSYQWGLFFGSTEEQLPFRPPALQSGLRGVASDVKAYLDRVQRS
jgi:hypothetical protein